MSTTLSLQGVRGGVGVTTMVVALGHALHAQGERVLLVECSPDHLLGLHLGLPMAETLGWARAWLDDADWRDAAFESMPGLALLPHGALADAEEVEAVEERLRQAPRLWSELQAARRIAPNDANVIRKLVQFYGRTDPSQLETYAASLPAAQRALYADELRNLRLARLLRAGDPEQALDMYARAMEEDGLIAPQQAQPRDNRALTFASRETAGDEWLRRSLRSDVETLYQQQNPTLTVMQDSGRRSDGTPGISRLSRDTRIVHLDAPFAGGLGWARLEQVRLDARRFETDANGFHDQDFGSCDLSLLRPDGSSLQAPGCDTRLRQRMNSSAGFAVGWRTLDDRWNLDIGHTPAGYAVGNWLGGVTVNGDLGRLGWGATLSRRPMTNSLLSQAGAIDPRSGIVWGGVTANGVTFSLGYDEGGRNGIWSNWSWHRLTGRNVMDNDRARAMAGWYHKLIQRPDLRLDVGLTGMYWRYAHDLGGYSLGQGGYYSPQRYASLSVPVSLAWRNDDWSLRVDASLSVSNARTASISRFPEQSLIERVIEQLQPLYGPLTLDPAGLYTADSSSTGSGHRLYMAVERRLGDHLVLGAAGTVQRSQDYSPNTFQIYLRSTLKPWQGNLPLPVSPLVSYGEFR